MGDDHNLQRFIQAQESVLQVVETELAAGRKRSHWMWFIFPQLKGLGHSMMANHYGIRDLDEARAYLQHPVLGERLRHHTELVLATENRSAEEIFGYPDYLKFRSCMTLFSQVAEEDSPFQRALERFYGGEPDSRSLHP